MKLGDNGDVQFEMNGVASQSARPAAPQRSSAAHAYVSEPQRARRGSVVPAIAFSIVLAIVAAGAYVYMVRPPEFEALFGQRVEPDDADRFIVERYYLADPAHVLVAREAGSNYRLLPFARDDVAVLAETTAREVLTVTGVVRQPDGEWYQVRLRDGRTAYLKASLAVVHEVPTVESDEGVVAEASPDSSAPSPIGFWTIYVQWGTDPYVNSDPMEIRADGNWYSEGVRGGTWTQSGSRVVLTFQGGQVVELNLEGESLYGMMRSTTGQTGTFSARRS